MRHRQAAAARAHRCGESRCRQCCCCPLKTAAFYGGPAQAEQEVISTLAAKSTRRGCRHSPAITCKPCIPGALSGSLESGTVPRANAAEARCEMRERSSVQATQGPAPEVQAASLAGGWLLAPCASKHPWSQNRCAACTDRRCNGRRAQAHVLGVWTFVQVRRHRCHPQQQAQS